MYQTLQCDARQICCHWFARVGSLFGKLAEEKMRRVAVSGAVALFLIVLNAKGFAAHCSPIPISDCESITQSGNYVLTNDLVLTAIGQGYGQGGNCLVIKSSHVNIDLAAYTITIACPPFSFCPSEYGVVGGIGIDVMNGSNHVSISNGSVEGFVYGIAGEADHISATNLRLTAVVGIALNNVSRSTFTDLTYERADMRYHGSNGPILYLNRGGANTFTNLSGDVGSDLGGPGGIEIVNSNANLISSLNLQNVSCGGTDILLSKGSSFNIITNSTLFDVCGGGIEVAQGSRHNAISGNTVTIASPRDVFAMFDLNPNCGSDVWINNDFSNILATGQISASPANCIH
jgi:hypothetical protein